MTADGILSVRVAARPVDGKANAAVEALLAKTFNVPKSRVSVMKGQGARLKQVDVDADETTVAAILASLGG